MAFHTTPVNLRCTHQRPLPLVVHDSLSSCEDNLTQGSEVAEPSAGHDRPQNFLSFIGSANGVPEEGVLFDLTTLTLGALGREFDGGEFSNDTLAYKLELLNHTF